MRSRGWKYAFGISVFLFFLIFIGSIGLPIYTDELGYRWAHSRVWIEGNRLTTLYPQCQDGWPSTIPAWFLPFRALDSTLFYSLSHLEVIRFTGVAGSLVIIALLLSIAFQWLRRFRPENFSTLKVDTTILLVGILQIGVFPFLRVMQRPEQWVLGFLLLTLWVALKGSAVQLNRIKTILLSLVIGVSILGSYAYHLKPLFFVPYFLVCIFLFSKNRIVRGALSAWLVFCTLIAFRYYSEITICPDSPFMTYLQSRGTLPPKYFAQMPGFAISQGLKGLMGIKDYFQSFLFLSEYQSHWLPRNDHLGREVINFFVRFLWVALAITSGWWIFRSRKQKPVSQLSAQFLIPVTLFIGLMGMSFFQTEKNFYESILFYPFFALAVFCSITLASTEKFSRTLKVFSKAVLVMVLVSQLYLLFYSVRHFSEWTKKIALENQPSSISYFNRAEREARTMEAASVCGINDSPNLYRVVVDDYTAPYFWHTRDPYHISYITGFHGQRIPALKVFMARRKSSGLIVQCKNIPEDFLYLVQKVGDLCCSPPQEIIWRDIKDPGRWERVAK